MNDNIEKVTLKLQPFKKICMTIGELPASYVESMSYYEMLVWFIHYLRDEVIPVVNANSEATEELQKLFVELQNYVNDYFNNLDVQEEINNKLDDMAESGELTDIIAQYLGLAGMITFDSVADMKLAENLVNGSKCCTLGYYLPNDGGNGIYKIRTKTNADVPDEGSIISIGELLVAELIVSKNTITTKQFGAIGNGVNDDLTKIQNALNFAKNNAPITLLVNGFHYIDGTLNLIGTADNRVKNICIEGIPSCKSYLEQDSIMNGFKFNVNYNTSQLPTACIDIDYSYGININNLKITSNEDVVTGEVPLNNNYGIAIKHSSSTSITNCNITKFFTGIFSSGSGLAYIANNNVSLCNLGIELLENGDSTLENNYLNTMGSGIYALDGTLKPTYATLRSANKLYAMGLYVGGSGNMTIRGGKIEWCAVGIWQDYTTNMIYNNIQFDRCNVCGIAITGHNSTINRTSILNSNFTGCGGTTPTGTSSDTHIGGLTGCCIGANNSFGILVSNNKFYGDNGTLNGSFKSGSYYYGPLYVLRYDRVYSSSFVNNIVEIDNNHAFALTNTEMEFNDNITNKFMSIGANTVIYRQAGLKREFYHYSPTTLTFGNFDLNDVVFNQNNITQSWRVSTAGTAESISATVSVVTQATDYYPADNTVLNLGATLANGIRTGAYVTIAGVSGTKKIVGVIHVNNTYFAKVDTACDVAVTNATMTNVSPAFTQL